MKWRRMIIKQKKACVEDSCSAGHRLHFLTERAANLRAWRPPYWEILMECSAQNTKTNIHRVENSDFASGRLWTFWLSIKLYFAVVVFINMTVALLSTFPLYINGKLICWHLDLGSWSHNCIYSVKLQQKHNDTLGFCSSYICFCG